MAYVLGFFAADGCMIENKRGGHFIEFHITDLDILEKIRALMRSDNKISTRKTRDGLKTAYRLQIGSKKMFDDLLKIGFEPRKSNTVELPLIPGEYFSDFVRGYFDGDGNVYANEYQRKGRRRKSVTLLAGFTCGSKKILEKLHESLRVKAKISGGTIYGVGGYYRLYYSVKDSCKLCKFMYNTESELFLARKKSIFDNYFRRHNIAFQ